MNEVRNHRARLAVLMAENSKMKDAMQTLREENEYTLMEAGRKLENSKMSYQALQEEHRRLKETHAILTKFMPGGGDVENDDGVIAAEANEEQDGKDDGEKDDDDRDDQLSRLHRLAESQRAELDNYALMVNDTKVALENAKSECAILRRRYTAMLNRKLTSEVKSDDAKTKRDQSTAAQKVGLLFLARALKRHTKSNKVARAFGMIKGYTLGIAGRRSMTKMQTRRGQGGARARRGGKHDPNARATVLEGEAADLRSRLGASEKSNDKLRRELRRMQRTLHELNVSNAATRKKLQSTELEVSELRYGAASKRSNEYAIEAHRYSAMGEYNSERLSRLQTMVGVEMHHMQAANEGLVTELNSLEAERSSLVDTNRSLQGALSAEKVGVAGD